MLEVFFGHSTARDLTAGIFIQFWVADGGLGSASAERNFRPENRYNPSPGSFTHSSVFCPDYRIFGSVSF